MVSPGVGLERVPRGDRSGPPAAASPRARARGTTWRRGGAFVLDQPSLGPGMTGALAGSARHRRPDLLHQGSVCDVFLERGSNGRPHCVLKRLSRRFESGTNRYRSAIAWEVTMLGELDRPGLPELLDFDVSAERPWMRYRWLEGESMAEATWCNGPGLARALARGLLGHLQYLHDELGIVHGDVSARNVLAAPGGSGLRVALIDFGNAWPQDAPRRLAPQPAYRAPEQVSGYPWSTPVDVFQAGQLIWEVLADVRRRGAGGVMPWVDELPSRWREWLAAVLAADPANRPSAGEA